MDLVNVLLVLCEGPHDCAFVRLVLRKLLKFEIADLKFSEMPAPFHKLFEMAVKTHAAKDMSLDMAHKFFLPDTVLRRDKDVVFLFNCGGKNQYDKVRTLLSSYIPMLEQAATFPEKAAEMTSHVRYLFLYDADAGGLDTSIKMLNTEFAKIDDYDFISGEWVNSRSSFGKVLGTKAVFVWGAKPEKGTLEDILVPMVNSEAKNQENFEHAKAAMNKMFSWDCTCEDAERAVAENEKLQKAILTTVGQRKKPGSSLNVILEQGGIITSKALESCPITAGFAAFIEDFLKVALAAESES